MLETHIGEHFHGLVTGSTAEGVWVRIFTPPAEGKLIPNGARLNVGDKTGPM